MVIYQIICVFGLYCRCVAAFASDLLFLQISVNPHRRVGLKTRAVSLDHS